MKQCALILMVSRFELDANIFTGQDLTIFTTYFTKETFVHTKMKFYSKTMCVFNSLSTNFKSYGRCFCSIFQVLLRADCNLNKSRNVYTIFSKCVLAIFNTSLALVFIYCRYKLMVLDINRCCDYDHTIDITFS